MSQTALFLGALIAFLVFSDWFNPGDRVVTRTDGEQFQAVVRYELVNRYVLQLQEPLPWEEPTTGDQEQPTTGDEYSLPKSQIARFRNTDAESWVVRVHGIRWYLAGAMGLLVLLMTARWFDKTELTEWMANTWTFTKLLVPLLFGGVLVVGFLGELLPIKQMATLVDENDLTSNLIASVVGCLFYFATLTEIPILDMLRTNGMEDGPALALLLAGPAMSIPSILVIRSILGNVKTAVFTGLVVVMATVAGMCYGTFVGETAGSPRETPARGLAVEQHQPPANTQSIPTGIKP